MFDPEIEGFVLNRLDEDPPFIMELTSIEVVMLGALSFVLGVLTTILCLFLLSGTPVWMFGFGGMVTTWPIGKRIFNWVNDMKKGKPAGYVGHKVQILVSKWLSFAQPSFIYHKGSWEVER